MSFDARDAKASVSELGVRLADEGAAHARQAGFEGEVLASSALSVRLAEQNIDKVALHTLEGVTEESERLGVDVVVFGTIRRDYAVGDERVDTLTIQWSAFDVMARSLVLEDRLTIRSDQLETRERWTWIERDSLWEPGNSFPVPPREPSLDREVIVRSTLLARRVASQLTESGDIYLAPTDTSTLVNSVQRLRAAQSAFASIYADRAKTAEDTGAPVDLEKPFILDGQEVAGLSGARAYIESLREATRGTGAARFSESISTALAESLLPRLPADSRLIDLGSTKWSDTQLVEGELAQGGLVRSLLARQALLDSNVRLAIAPRLERFGDRFLLRVQVYDLSDARLLASTHTRLDRLFTDEIARELTLGPMP